jgi:hypothetical protein
MDDVHVQHAKKSTAKPDCRMHRSRGMLKTKFCIQYKHSLLIDCKEALQCRDVKVAMASSLSISRLETCFC